jgi:hypothetical protein
MMKPTLQLTLITVGTAVYLGIAILGGGGFAAFFSHPALIALSVVLFALAGAALFAGGNLSPGEREDRGNRWVLIAFGVLGLLGAYLPAYTDRQEFWTLDGNVIRWFGVVLFAAGGALRLWPVFVLGDRFSGLVTAYGDDERRRRAGELGAAEFITKPVDFEHLKAQLRDLPAAAD